MDPAATPLTSIEQGFYVDPPRSVSQQIVARAEIEPTARQLVVGSIGSGKTTELLVARDRMGDVEDLAPFYVDVSEKLDLSALRAGWLVAAASQTLVDALAGCSAELRGRVKAWCDGYESDPYESDPEYDWTPGILTKANPWPNIEHFHVDDLRTLATAHRSVGRKPILLFDGLDRLGAAHLERFAHVVEQDVDAIHTCEIGLVLVGPIRSLEGFGRLEADRFDVVHEQSPIDVRQPGAGRDFLTAVLRKRADETIVRRSALSLLVEASGGVLRDLMALAKQAGQAAFLDGRDSIDDDDARAAIDHFGRSLLIGLEPGTLSILEALGKTGLFLTLGPTEGALLATRRVLRYGSAGDYALHPSIAAVLAEGRT